MGFGLLGGRATTPYRNAEAAAQTDLAVLRACTSEDAVRIAVLQMNEEGAATPEADTTGGQLGVATDHADAIMDAHAGPDQPGHSSPPGAHVPLVADELEEDTPTGNPALALPPAEKQKEQMRLEAIQETKKQMKTGIAVPTVEVTASAKELEEIEFAKQISLDDQRLAREAEEVGEVRCQTAAIPQSHGPASHRQVAQAFREKLIEKDLDNDTQAAIIASLAPGFSPDEAGILLGQYEESIGNDGLGFPKTTQRYGVLHSCFFRRWILSARGERSKRWILSARGVSDERRGDRFEDER